MCGIAGLFNVQSLLAQPLEALAVLSRMMGSMVHRGPDADGHWADDRGRCLLGHRRLSIIDTSDAGRQPMTNVDGRWVISFNGELYNFQDLRSELEAEGMSFRGRTDTEVLLQSLVLWGLDALPKLDGMFAFAAFDRDSGELILARDAFGEKPLYYMELPQGGLAFASELQALEAVPGFRGEVSVDAMAEVLMFQYVGAPRTIYQHVKKLEPGHWLVAKPGEPTRQGRYYEFRPGVHGFDARPMKELADELEALLIKSIRRRLISDVPLGAFLSGGVDSSTVCALITRRLGRPLKTFSIGFEGAPESEHEAARAFARHLGCEHYDQILSPDASEFLAGIGRILDEPNGDSSCMPTYLLSEFARRHVTVAVSGDGGDEMFAGYGRYFATLDEERAFHSGNRREFQPGQAYYADRILVSTERYIEELFGTVPPALALHLDRLRTQVNQAEPPLFCRLRKTDVDNYLPGAVLPKVDRMSMRHSLEVRTPFLNTELASFAERLQLSNLYSAGRGKLLLREVAYRYLPRRLLDTPKRGFGIPMSKWAREQLLGVAGTLLEGTDCRLREVLGDAGIQRFLSRQRVHGGFSAYQVWALVTLESWLRHHPATLPRLDHQPHRELSSASNSAALPANRPSPGRLTAWPLGKGRFAVIEDQSLRLDALDDASEAERQQRADLKELLLYIFLATSDAASGDEVLPEVDASATVEIPGWGQDARDADLRRSAAVRGSALIFPDTEAMKKLDARELSKFSGLGVSELVFFHPYRYDRAIVRFRLKRTSLVARLRRAAALWPKRAALFHRLLVRHNGGSRYASRHLAGLPGLHDVELSGRFMLFEGLRQLPPAQISHEDIARLGGGRYSIWSQRCIFSPSSKLRLLSRPYWLVEKTPETEPWLEIVPEVPDAMEMHWTQFLDTLEGRLAAEADLDSTCSLQRGDTIVLLTHALPPGGAERQWCYLASALRSRAFDVVFLVTGALHGMNGHYAPLLRSLGIEPVSLASQPLADVLAHTPSDEQERALLLPGANPFGLTLKLLTTYLDRLRPKVVIAQLDMPNLLAGIAGHLARVPKVILSFRNYNPSHFSYLSAPWLRRCYHALSRSGRVTLSGNSHAGNEDYADWIGIPRDSVAWIPNAIDPVDFPAPLPEQRQALFRELELAEGQPIILGVFRLSEEKQPEMFVEACRRVAQRVPNIRVLIAGIGPLQQQTDEAIRKAGLSGRVTLLGRRTDVPVLMSIASVVLLASRYEGTPNVLMEAQLAGVPVVATKVGGTPDCVIDGVTGLLADKDDVDGLADRCIAILSDAKLAADMGSRGRDLMRAHFGKARVASLYETLASGGSVALGAVES